MINIILLGNVLTLPSFIANRLQLITIQILIILLDCLFFIIIALFGKLSKSFFILRIITHWNLLIDDILAIIDLFIHAKYSRFASICP